MNLPYGLQCVENCLSCHLRSQNFFCSLPEESLAAFNQIKHAAIFPEHAVIFVEGQAPRGIFMLCQGQAKLSITSREGKTLIVRIAKPGEVLGLHASVTGNPHEFTVETMRPCQLNFVNQEDFQRFLKKHGDACLHAAQHLGRDCRDAYEMIRSIGLSHTVSGRVAKFLLESAIDGDVTDGAVRVTLALTHEDISQLVGTTRDSITRTLSEFKRNEMAELKGSTLIIHNKLALEKLVTSSC
jgi:CRP/FNR family cyclic AMP-dependent transcriptional regulator